MDAIVQEKAAAIRLMLMDVDGVWTDGTIFYVPGPDGEMVEIKTSHSQDGMALRWAHGAGIASGLISGRDSPVVTHRAKMLGVTYIYQGYLEKIPLFEEICEKAGLSDEQVAFVGDDLTDLPLIRRAGLGVAVANARDEVKRQADFVTSAPGGYGAIRETVELLMSAQGTWQQVLEKYGAA